MPNATGGMRPPKPQNPTALDRIVAINKQRVSPLGVQQRDIQIAKAQAALQKSRIKIVNGTKYYDSSGTN